MLSQVIRVKINVHCEILEQQCTEDKKVFKIVVLNFVSIVSGFKYRVSCFSTKYLAIGDPARVFYERLE